MARILPGLCCANRLTVEVPPSRTDLCYGLCDGYAERGVAVQNGYADLDLGDLAIKVSRHEALAQQLYTMHPIVGKTIHRIVF